ncbi:MAG TPA: nitrogenase iron protein [Lachnospiraceae bacterium]|jgi:nitrogenase iron protein NifH|nr:nitrogenase iron protein [Lachnospiraceae bacterium]
MIKFAIYGKGGIGKSTLSSNLSAAFAKRGFRVMQIGCDPKADSTSLLCPKEKITTVLDLVRSGKPFTLQDMVKESSAGVLCVEAGGPIPGLGCAGRGIINALESLEQKGAYELYKPDIVIYDVLGDVVCGGFTMPMRKGYADKVYIVTSGEKMSIYAAANIAMAVDNFKKRDYAKLGGIILNCRGVENEEENAATLAKDFDTEVLATIPRSSLFEKAEAEGKTIVELFPDSDICQKMLSLADRIMELSDI